MSFTNNHFGQFLPAEYAGRVPSLVPPEDLLYKFIDGFGTPAFPIIQYSAEYIRINTKDTLVYSNYGFFNVSKTDKAIISAEVASRTYITAYSISGNIGSFTNKSMIQVVKEGIKTTELTVFNSFDDDINILDHSPFVIITPSQQFRGLIGAAPTLIQGVWQISATTPRYISLYGSLTYKTHAVTVDSVVYDCFSAKSCTTASTNDPYIAYADGQLEPYTTKTYSFVDSNATVLKTINLQVPGFYGRYPGFPVKSGHKIRGYLDPSRLGMCLRPATSAVITATAGGSTTPISYTAANTDCEFGSEVRFCITHGAFRHKRLPFYVYLYGVCNAGNSGIVQHPTVKFATERDAHRMMLSVTALCIGNKYKLNWKYTRITRTKTPVFLTTNYSLTWAVTWCAEGPDVLGANPSAALGTITVADMITRGWYIYPFYTTAATESSTFSSGTDELIFGSNVTLDLTYSGSSQIHMQVSCSSDGTLSLTSTCDQLAAESDTQDFYSVDGTNHGNI